MSVIDSVIEALSPSWAARRAAARAVAERSKLATDKLRGFNAVSKGRRAGDDWTRVGEGGPTESSKDIETLRARAHEMGRNNPHWKAAKRTIVAEVVGHGIRAVVDVKSETRKKALQSSWDEWAGSRLVDVTGRIDWYGVQALVMSTVIDDGECIVLRRMQGTKLRLQVLGGEFLCSTADRVLENGGEISGGVETDEYGAAVAYHIYQRHPGRDARTVIRFDARDVAHVFLVERPNQLRGVPWIAPVFTRLQDWDDYEDAELMRQKVSACFGAVYTGVEPESNGGGAYELPEKLEPGMLEYMPPGTDLKLIAPPASQGFRDAALITHRAIAAGLGITYEALTGDFERVNFSSARMGRLQMLANVRRWQQHVMIDLLCDRVWGWFVDAYTLQALGADEVPSTRGLTVQWVAPSRALIDPEKETKADAKRVRTGFTPWSDVVREQGRDPKQVARQIADDFKMFDELGLTLDIDPRRVSEFGQGAVNILQETKPDEQDSQDDEAA